MTAPAGGDLLGHLAVALDRHREWALRTFGDVPAEFAAIADALAASARKRQGPTFLAELERSRDSEPVPKLLNVKAVARVLSVDERTVERKIASGELAAVKLGQRTLVRVADLDEFIAALPAKAVA